MIGKELITLFPIIWDHFQVDMNIMDTLKIRFNKYSSAIGPCLYENWDQKQSSKQESYLEPFQMLNTVISRLFFSSLFLPPGVLRMAMIPSPSLSHYHDHNNHSFHILFFIPRSPHLAKDNTCTPPGTWQEASRWFFFFQSHPGGIQVTINFHISDLKTCLSSPWSCWPIIKTT